MTKMNDTATIDINLKKYLDTMRPLEDLLYFNYRSYTMDDPEKTMYRIIIQQYLLLQQVVFKHNSANVDLFLLERESS